MTNEEASVFDWEEQTSRNDETNDRMLLSSQLIKEIANNSLIRNDYDDDDSSNSNHTTEQDSDSLYPKDQNEHEFYSHDSDDDDDDEMTRELDRMIQQQYDDYMTKELDAQMEDNWQQLQDNLDAQIHESLQTRLLQEFTASQQYDCNLNRSITTASKPRNESMATNDYFCWGPMVTEEEGSLGDRETRGQNPDLAVSIGEQIQRIIDNYKKKTTLLEGDSSADGFHGWYKE